MARTFRRSLLVLVLALAALPASASAAEPPWCGTPEPDYSSDVLADGTDADGSGGSFPHIPHYAIGCTLADIQDAQPRPHEGRGDRQVRARPQHVRRRHQPRCARRDEKRAYLNWLAIRATALESPNLAQKLLTRHGRRRQGADLHPGRHPRRRVRGRRRGDRRDREVRHHAVRQDPKVDEILSNAILVFNVDPEPGRARLRRRAQNGNGFDLNRDYLTQSQPETLASIKLMKRWLAPEMLDLHGYSTPTLIEATTKPHNPSIEYDLWLKWNQPRIDFNEAALDAIGQDVQRPINDWCPEADRQPPARPIVPETGVPPGPDVAEGWDDWGPFYAPMYHQHVGLDSSTVEMCTSRNPRRTGSAPCGGRAGARSIQTVVQESTIEFVVANRAEMLHDELEIYRRGDVDAPRPACCPDPFKPEFHNWMLDYPQGVRDPGRQRPAQRRRGEPARRVGAVQRHRGRRARARLSRSARRRSRRARTSSGWPSRGAASPTPRSASESTSRPASSASTRRRRRGATATCGAPTR